MSDKPEIPARKKFMGKMKETEIPIPAWSQIQMIVDEGMEPNGIKITCGREWYDRWHKQQFGN